MISPVQQFWYYLILLGKKDESFTVLKPYGVTDFKYLNMEVQEEVVDMLRNDFKARAKKPRASVIHYLCVMPNHNYKIADTPDYEKINAWVASKFKGKELNKLSLSELNLAVSAVKEWYRKELKN